MREICLENTFVTIRTIQWGEDIWLQCGLISLKTSGCYITTNILQQTNIFEEHSEFIKIDQKDTIQTHQLKRQPMMDRQTDMSWQLVRSYNAEPSCQIALGKRKCKKSAHRWRKYLTTSLFFFYKKAIC